MTLNNKAATFNKSWRDPPHTQTVGVPTISQSYLRWIASLNSLLFRSLSMSLLGITVNQFDAPFSLAKLTALFVLGGREFLHSSDHLSNLSCFSFFAFCCSSVISASSGGSCSCDIILSARGALTLIDAWNSAFAL